MSAPYRRCPVQAVGLWKQADPLVVSLAHHEHGSHGRALETLSETEGGAAKGRSL